MKENTLPHYDYICYECNHAMEIFHGIKDSSSRPCPKCNNTEMIRQIGGGSVVIIKSGGIDKHKESEHKKKVHDKERAVKMRKKAFGSDAVGDPSDRPDPRHIIKRGRTLGGQEKEVDRAEFIKAAAKDPMMVKKAEDVLKKHDA